MTELNEIYSLPATSRYFLIALICAIIMIAVYWQDILPLRQALAVSHQQEKQLTAQLQKLYSRENVLEEKMGALPETKAMLNEWQKKFIKQGDMNKLLKEIIAISKRDKLRLTVFDPGLVMQVNVIDGATPVRVQLSQGQHYFKQSFKVALEGSYAQTARFIEQITNLPWTVVVGNFSLNKLPVEDMYSIQMLMYVYYLKNA